MIHNPIKDHLEFFDFELFYERLLEDESRSQAWRLHHLRQEDFSKHIMHRKKLTKSFVEKGANETEIPVKYSFTEDDFFETSILDILHKRRSIPLYEMSNNWTYQDLEKLLSLSAGISHQKQESHKENKSEDTALRVYPSGGLMYSVNLCLYSRNVSGLPDGMYYYDANQSNLKKLGGARTDAELEEMFPMTDFNLESKTKEIENISVMMFLVVDFERSFQKYGRLAYRLGLLEAGHIAQNIQLISTAINRNSHPYCGFYADRVEEELGIRKDKYKHCFYTLFLG
ncbi:SagB family peptide dehydrogenase [Sediminibacillus sp. JSM 1682029]|uniref:SagB family peptide dehydrogenase n=1 Tax=Sediminibacillus sp. JSM 1682029 TaxID=3229857 RepID=UPI003526129A